jgi:hypothetical protein
MIRNFIFTTITFFFLGSCKEGLGKREALPVPLNSQIISVNLVDSLGTVTLAIPNRYDTSFVWVDHSDCGKPCDMQKYRFQPKILKVTKESGFIWLGEPKDSVERLTISHSGYFPFHAGDTAEDLARHKQLRAKLASDASNPPVIFDTLEKINDRYYSIVAMEKSDTIRSKRVLAITTIKGNEIQFEYDILTKKNDSIGRDFIKNSLDLIHTIHINKGL